jgi:hypothetical protein
LAAGRVIAAMQRHSAELTCLDCVAASPEIGLAMIEDSLSARLA